MSTVVAGVDFGTLSVRVSLVDSERGPSRFGGVVAAINTTVMPFPACLTGNSSSSSLERPRGANT